MTYKELLNAMCVRLGFLITSKKTWVWIVCVVFFAMGKMPAPLFERVTWAYFLANVAIHAIDKWRAWFDNKKLREKIGDADAKTE